MNLPQRVLHLFPNRVGHAMLVLLLGVLAFDAWAAGSGNPEDAVDPPGRVGRIADTSGQVWLFAPEAGEWVSAVRNRPITTGNRLSTDAGARAEVRIGSTTLRLDSGSELEVLRLDDERVALQLHNGSAAVRLRSREAASEFELNTGEGRFRTPRAGRYRFDRSDDTSHVTVYSGEAVYEGPGSALTVYSGQRAEFWLDSANAAQYSIIEPQRDAFAAWNSERDGSDDRSAATRYVSPEMTGAEDLDRYGRWEQSPEYGSLWIPRAVAPGWAPYSTGQWAWVQPWGWTWVDDAPWGFAPFHYGRWVWFRSAWCWAPGTRVHRPVYAPALVAWIGGPHASVSISIGGGPAPAVGWFPLAPREVYVPTYRVSPGYVRNVNVTHVTNITNITTIINNPQGSVGQRDFSNRKFPHAVTVVPASVLTQRQPVAAAAAQWRDHPGVRELVRDPARAPVLVAAPPAPVAAPARAQDARAPSGSAAVVQPQLPPAPAGRMTRPPSDRSAEERQPRVPLPGREPSPANERRGNEPRDVSRTRPAPPAVPPVAAQPPVAAPAVPPQGVATPAAPAVRPQVVQTPAAPAVQLPSPAGPQSPAVRQVQPAPTPGVANGQPQILARPPHRDVAERGGQPVPQGEARARVQRPAPGESPRQGPRAETVSPPPPKNAHVEPAPPGKPREAQRPAAPEGRPVEAQNPRGRVEGHKDGRDERREPRERQQN